MTYPIAVLIFSILILIFIMLTVVPKFEDILRTLTRITRADAVSHQRVPRGCAVLVFDTGYSAGYLALHQDYDKFLLYAFWVALVPVEDSDFRHLA